MATVITNLMSAIPWVGQDIVEFISIAIISLFICVILFSLKKDIYLPTRGIIHKKKNQIKL